jgi:hypothetical protein
VRVQSNWVGKRVKVEFKVGGIFNTCGKSPYYQFGEISRDDAQEPFITEIILANGLMVAVDDNISYWIL